MVIDLPVPSNISYLWNFGFTLAFVLVVQIATGIFLAMHYCAHVDLAFISVEHIMRDVNYGWLIRYAHANGASMFFVAVYIHIGRGLYYGSYTKPRDMVWNLGVIIYLIMMLTAFIGKSLPKMSPLIIKIYLAKYFNPIIFLTISQNLAPITILLKNFIKSKDNISTTNKKIYSCQHSKIIQRPRETEVYSSHTNKLLVTYPTLKKLAKKQGITYRTARQYLKSGLIYKKLGIIIKYKNNLM